MIQSGNIVTACRRRNAVFAGVEERGGVDRKRMVLPRSKWVERRKVSVGVVAWFTCPPEARDINANVVGADFCYDGFAEAVVGEAEEAHEAVKGPDSEGGVEPVLVGSGVAEAVYEVILDGETHSVSDVLLRAGMNHRGTKSN